MPTVRDTADLRFAEPVDVRRRYRPRQRPNEPRATTTRQVTVDPRVMAAAKAALRPGQRIVIEDAGTVRLVNG